MSIFALVGDRDVPVLYSSYGDCFGIGKSHCPFPCSLGVHDTCFQLEDSFSTREIECVEVVEVSRRHVWWIIKDPEEEEEEGSEGSQEESASDDEENEESLWGSSSYPEG